MYIDGFSKGSKANVQLVNAFGTIVQQRIIIYKEGMAVDIDLSAYAKGAYLIRIVSGSQSLVSRFVVQ